MQREELKFLIDSLSLRVLLCRWTAPFVATWLLAFSPLWVLWTLFAHL